MRLDKAPLGLLELFRLRTQGDQPDEFSRVVAASADCRDFYGANLLGSSVVAGVAAALTNLNTKATLTQPVRLRGIGATLTVGAAPITAGGFVEVGLFVVNLQAAAPLQFQTFGVALATQVVGVGTPLDIVVPAGSQIYARAGGTAAGVDHVLNVNYLYENYTQLQ